MSDDYAEALIAQMRRFGDMAKPMPRWFKAKQAASFAMLRRFWRTAPPPTVFHYTSTAGLISIVSNNELWLSEATFLNDRREIEHGRRLACGRLEAQIAKEVSPEVRAMLERARSRFADWSDPEVYVACFSFEGDDLTQWRAYGGIDGPVAIEFEHSPMMFGYTAEGVLDRVLYDTSDQQWVFDNMLAAFADAYREDVRDPIAFERKGPPLSRDEEDDIVATSLYHALWQHIVTCKDPAFIAEREVRFIYTAHDFRQSSMSWVPEHPAPRFRERGGRVIPYLTSKNLDFQNLDRVGETPKLPIRSVRIGPVAEPSVIERGVRRLLDVHGHGAAQITGSTAPYRSR